MSAKSQSSTSSGSGLVFWTIIEKISSSISVPLGQHFLGFGYFSLWFMWSLYKCSKSQRSTSSGSGLALLDTHVHPHLYVEVLADTHILCTALLYSYKGSF
jgi:hypothetical protein